MTTSMPESTLRTSAFLIVACLPLLLNACSDDQAVKAAPSAAKKVKSESPASSSAGVIGVAKERSPGSTPLIDSPLAASRIALLQQAFETASKLPIDPHEKTRCRKQGEVVEACIELGQANLARDLAGRISNWRRGVAYASLARHLATSGQTADVEHYLGLAMKAADESVAAADFQEWRRDRVRVGVAQVRALLGDPEGALKAQASVVESEMGKVGVDVVALEARPAFDQQVDAIDGVLHGGSLDQVRSALSLCVNLFDHFYGDADRRAILEARIRNGFEKLPLGIRIGFLTDASQVAVRKGDNVSALDLIRTARLALMSGQWLTEEQVPLMARLAELRYHAGEPAEAAEELLAARKLYEANRARVVDIFRARALTPLAEAFAATGNAAETMVVFNQALSESVVNPNSRPRAEDLTSICLAMARAGNEPDAATMKRVEEIHRGLSNPW